MYFLSSTPNKFLNLPLNLNQSSLSEPKEEKMETRKKKLKKKSQSFPLEKRVKIIRRKISTLLVGQWRKKISLSVPHESKKNFKKV